MPEIPNFIVADSIHGKFIIPRHCDHIIDFIAKTGRTHIEQEIANIVAICNTLPTNATAVDAGANIGLISIPMARALKKKGGTVHAFEPQRMLYQALCGNAVLNDLENLRPWYEALGDGNIDESLVDALVVDYSTPGDYGQVQIPSRRGLRSDSSDSLTIVALDDCGIDRLDFLKIDVEGMETDVLAGATALIKDHEPWLWVEYWKTDPEKIKAALPNRTKYRFYRMDELNMLCAPESRISGIAFNHEGLPSI